MHKILVTGATGFIGSHLVQKLLERDDVYALERYVTGRYLKFDRRIKTCFGDLRDYYSLAKIIKEIQPDIVVHLAAVSPVEYSYSHPQEVMEINLLGTINLAEACLKFIPHLKHFVFAGTTEEYGITPQRPATEESVCIPNSPYAVSKNAATKYLLYLNKAYGFPATIMRATNTYGRKDDVHFFVEKTIYQMIKNEPQVRLGDPEPIREFMYVDDHVEAYLSVLNQPQKSVGNIFNFSTENPKRLREVVEEIALLTNYGGEVVWNTVPRRPLDILDHTISSEKARRILNWKAKVKLEEGLQKTIEYWSEKVANKY